MHRSLGLVRLVVIAVVGMLLVPASLSGRVDMVNGENTAGSISAPGEVDIYTFQATAGESIILAIGEVGNTAYAPWIRLFRPDNAQIGSQFGALAAQIDIVSAPATGTYTVWVASGDVGQDDTGSYTLTLAKTGAFSISGGDEGGPLTNGSNHSGMIHVGDLDMWSFDATAGDAVILHIGEIGTTGDFRPWIRLKGPSGQNVAAGFNVAGANIEVNVAATGTYTVVVASADAQFDDAGSYTLTLAKSGGGITISPGDQGGPMTNGSNHTGHIDVGDADAWTFSATAGDAVILHIGEVGTTGDFRPWIRLKGPTGLDAGEGFNVAGTYIEVNVTVTGIYTVVVASGDVNRDEVGDYTLTLAKSGAAVTISPGDQGGAMTNGSNHTGHIHVGDADAWTFSATAGDAVFLNIGEVGVTGDFRPWIRLKGPTGLDVGEGFNVAGTYIEVNVTVTGSYTVVVASADTAFDEAGDYTLTLTKTGSGITITPGDEGGPMVNGSNHTGHIHVGDADAWTFSATAGDSVILHIGEVGTTGDYRPWIRLRGPAGANVGTGFNVAATYIEVNVTVTGTYTVVVTSGDPFFDEVGDYTLTLAKTGSPFTISPSDEGGPTVNGASVSGVIHVGDLDIWSFQAAAGEALTIRVSDTNLDASFVPWVRVKGPTGLDLGDAFTASVAEFTGTATVTGTYFAVVASGDAGVDATGTYSLTIANAPRTFVVPGGDQGGPVGVGPSLGTITLGDIDMWSFMAHEGDNLSIVISETGVTNDFTPWIRLRSPTGVLAGNAFNATSASILTTAGETGIYTILVSTGDAGFEGTGNYTMNTAGMSTSMIKNGDFAQGETFWQYFGSPTQGHIVHQVTSGVQEYYRVPPPPDTLGQAIVFQQTGVALPVAAPVEAQFGLANSSTTRKRISVLILDASFADLQVCTFYLEPGAPMRTYQMRMHTTQAWTNAALYFYAASAGSDGGFYQIDNVSMAFVPDGATDRTECEDPTTLPPPGGSDSANLIVNGDFGTGQMTPWGTAFALTSQITGGVLEFTKPDNSIPSGVVLQTTGQAMIEGEHLTATFQVGNSSAARKRVTILLNDASFADLSVCTFWLPAGQPLSTYVFRTVTKKPWPNAMIHFYPATAGFAWFQLDNVTLQRTPNANIVGTECLEPGASSEAIGEEARQAPLSPVTVHEPEVASAITTAASATLSDLISFEITPPAAGVHVRPLTDAIDLRDTTTPQLALESWLAGSALLGTVQVSVDGDTWVTVAELVPSSDWTTVTIDLSPFAGQVVRVRFVLDARQPSESEEPAAWRIRNLRVVR